jgi:CDP-glucose 4,6-dehydratase
MSNFWQHRSVFITGGTGFLGSWLTDRLVGLGADVTCLIRDVIQNPPCFSAVRVVWGDVRDQPLMERAIGERQCRTVFHLAGQTQVNVANRNPVSMWDTNIRGTWSVLEACRRSPLVQQIIVASSDKAYGEQTKLPTTEDAPLLAINPYDASKACADKLAQSYASTWELPIAITRCGNLFGGGDRNWGRLIPGTIRRVLRGERPVIRGNGKATRDYLYVADAVDAFLRLAERLSPFNTPVSYGSAFNLSMSISETTTDVSELLVNLCGENIDPIFEPSEHELQNQSLDCSLARRRLDWEPTHTLTEGLKKTIAWYKENL